MSDDAAGTEAGGGDIPATNDPATYVQQLADEQAAAEAVESDAPVEAAPDEPKPDEGAEKPAEGEKAPLEPLTPEEYQKRHENINNALREERQEKRQLKEALAALQAEVAEIRATQPQQFQQFTLDQQIAAYEDVDWRAWYARNPEEAAAHQDNLEALTAQKQRVEKETRQQQEQRQQEAQRAQITQFVTTTQQQEAAFRAAKPDYDNAVAFLFKELVAEGETQGYFGDEAARYAQGRIIEVGQRVHAAGKNVAEFGYNLAVQNGYAPPAPDLASIKAGEAAAKTISNLGPKSNNDGGSFEENMSKLSGAAARAYWEKVKSQQHA